MVGGEEVVDDEACDELLGSGAHGGRGGTTDVGVGRSTQIQNGEGGGSPAGESSGDEVVTAGAVRLGVGATWGSFPSIPI